MRPPLRVISSIVIPISCMLLAFSTVLADETATDDSVSAGSTKDEGAAAEPDTFDPVGGVVVDSVDRPVQGANVVLRTQYYGILSSSKEPTGAGDLAHTKTDTSGRFDFPAVRVPIEDIVMRHESEPGLHWLDLVVSAPGFAIGWSHVVGAQMSKVVLRPEAKLHGRIADGYQRPVAGADVRVRYLMSVRHISQLDLELKHNMQSWPQSDDRQFMSLVGVHLPEVVAKTDGEGRFILRGLPPKSGAVLEIDHPDYQIERVYAITLDPLDPAVPVDAKRDVHVGEIHASLKRGHHVALKIVFDDTGKSAANAKFPFPPTFNMPQGIADDDGRFDYRHIASGELRLHVDAPERTDYLGATQTLTLNDGSFDHDVTVRLTRGVPVTGRVIDLRTKRGVPEVRLIGATETRPPPQKSLAPVPYGLATTDVEGAFRMVVPSGKGIVAIRHIDPRIGIYRPVLPVHVEYREVDPSMRKEVVLDADKPGKPIVFELTSHPPLHGRVFGHDGKPVPRADILGSIQRPGGGSLSFRQRASADGTFELPDLFQVDADVSPRATKVLVLDRRRKWGNIIDIEPDAPTDKPIEFSLVPMQTVTGRILDGTTGNPIESAKITLVGDTLTAPTVRTDANGRFSIIALVPGGHYSLRMDAPGYVSFNDNRTNFVAGTEDRDVGDLALRPMPNRGDFGEGQPKNH